MLISDMGVFLPNLVNTAHSGLSLGTYGVYLERIFLNCISLTIISSSLSCMVDDS